MWKNNESDCTSTPTRGFLTPPPKWRSPPSDKNSRWPPHAQSAKPDLYHVIHKVPSGNSPYVKAKHVQLIEKDPSKAISLFWAAINSGDRVDSALKDMAVVMKQLNRSDEAIEAIKSFRHLCPPESQESIDNILIELYKRSGRIKEEIELLELKLKHIEKGIAFGGKKTKIARSQGKKVQITIEKEYSRLLGNLAWSYMQLKNYKSAEEHYRKALSLEPDKNKQSNLAICLMHMNNITEAKFLIQSIKASDRRQMDESCTKSFERATQMLAELETHGPLMNYKEHEEAIFSSVESPKDLFTQPRRFSSSLNDGNWFAKDTATACSRKLLFEQTSNNNENKKQSAANHNFNKFYGSNMESGATSQPNTWKKNSLTADINTSASKNCEDGGNDVTTEKLECTNLQDFDLSACKSKKSWADIVEEDELGAQFFKTPSKYSDGNENVDSNIMNNLSQSTESLCLSEGYHTQPGRALTCSVYFDQLDRKESGSSNFQGKELKFGSLSSLPPIGDIANHTPGKLLRRNRLPVFRDITPESPKPLIP